MARILVYEFGRTKRVLVVPETDPSVHEPIFVIGVHRSGTTLVRLILDSHSRIACPPESFFLLSATGLLHDQRGLEGLEAMGFAESQVVAKVGEMIASFFQLHASSHGKARWADKTPSYIRCLDDIDRLFPSARYVMVYRNGLDVACSIAAIPAITDADEHIRACAGDRYAGAARYWASQCKVMRSFAASRGDRCLEVFYERLVKDPGQQTRQLFTFLGEEWEPGVLKFHEHAHDSWGGLEDRTAMRSKGFAPSIGKYTKQPSAVVEQMIRQAGPMLSELGYDF